MIIQKFNLLKLKQDNVDDIKDVVMPDANLPSTRTDGS